MLTIYLPSRYQFSYLSTLIWNLFLPELVRKMKSNVNSVKVHAQWSNNGHSLDGVLMGVGSMWPFSVTKFMSEIKVASFLPCHLCQMVWNLVHLPHLVPNNMTLLTSVAIQPKKTHGGVIWLVKVQILNFFWVKQAFLFNFEWYNLFMGFQ